MKHNFFLVLFLPVFASAGALSSKEFPKKVQNLIEKHGLKSSQLGLLISDSRPPHKIFYHLNADKLFIPASLTKVITLSALYDHFIPSHRFKTKLASSAVRTRNTLKGSLVFQGGGDPGFTSETLWNLVNVFFSLGITTITGDLLIDDTLFKKPLFLNRSNRSYEALTSATSFNWNSVTFRIRPSQPGQKAFVTSDPLTPYIHIVNKVTTAPSEKKTYISIVQKFHSREKEVFEVRGRISLSKKEKVMYRSIQHPAFWLGHNVKLFLAQRGIKVLGKIKKGTCLPPCTVLAEWSGKPFYWQAYNLTKYSSNFVSRMLTIQLSLLKGSQKGDISKGMALIRSFLKRAGITRYRFADPSGLSRKNRFRPMDIQKILIKDLKSYYQPEIFSSYPLAGGVGTLQDRYLDEMGLHPVRAKTGSLPGVLGLAGLMQSDKKYIFTFLFNGPYDKVNKAKDFFDDLTKVLMVGGIL